MRSVAPTLLFGFTQTTIEIALHLQQKGYPFIIIDTNTLHVKDAQKFGFDFRCVDYNEDEELCALGIGSSLKTVFALFEEDAKNIFLTLSLKALDESITIIALTHTKDAIHKLKIAGVETVLDPYLISGKRIYKHIVKPEVMEIIDATILGKHDIGLEQITITASSKLKGMLMDDLIKTLTYNIIILGIHDKEMQKPFIFISEGHNHQLDSEDILVVIGESNEIDQFKKAFLL